jgi:putative hydrolase of the HAD superfamily
MIETAIELTQGRVPAAVIGEILAAGHEMLAHPVETLPQAKETLQHLAGTYRIVLITKGDLFDQERKLAQSGLGDFFDAVEIVSDKTASTYERIFVRHGQGPALAMMVGNSLRSDIVPAIKAGSWGVHIPHALTWALEHDDAPVDEPRFKRLDHLGELIGLLAEIEAA